MFGRKQAKIDGLKMAFYTDAAEHGWHGKILVTSRRRGLERVVVNFVFIGMTEPPALTPALMEHIWTEAKAQGFVPFEIVDALEVNKAPVLTPEAPLAPAVTAPRRAVVLPPANTPVDLSVGDLSMLSGPVSMYDPEQAARAEIPAFLRKQTSEAVTA